jgi:uncharacterized protein with FMN-binding domain
VDINNTNKSIADQHQTTLSALVADGIHSGNLDYYSPGGTETVSVSVTLKDDIITAISVIGVNADPRSSRYISAVNGALPSLVVGKRIDQISLPRQISGSSLTTAAVGQYLSGLLPQ